jgi:hypothetical protein
MTSTGDKACRHTQTGDGVLPAERVAACRVACSGIFRTPGFLAVTIAGLCLAAGSAMIARGQTPDEGDDRQEYNVKLAYLCNFVRYIAWPADAAAQEKAKDGEWIIGVLGEDPFRGALDRVAASGRRVVGRKIIVRHFTSLDHYRPCHILFIPKTAPRKQHEAAIRALRGKPVLLVGETVDFAAIGGCVNFYRDEDNVRFEINLDALRDHHVEASSKLLALAKIVKRP